MTLDAQFAQAYTATLELYTVYNGRMLQEIKKPKEQRNRSIIEGQQKLADSLHMMSSAFGQAKFYQEKYLDLRDKMREALKKNQLESEKMELRYEGLQAENDQLKKRVEMLESILENTKTE